MKVTMPVTGGNIIKMEAISEDRLKLQVGRNSEGVEISKKDCGKAIYLMRQWLQREEMRLEAAGIPATESRVPGTPIPRATIEDDMRPYVQEAVEQLPFFHDMKAFEKKEVEATLMNTAEFAAQWGAIYAREEMDSYENE